MNRTLLEAPFPPEQIRQREGKAGQVLDYVKGSAVIQRLNEALSGRWSFEVLEHQILLESNEVLVLGKLTVDDQGIKTQFGSSKLTLHRETKEPVSLGDDLKAAATDALKKCATHLGVGLYLYNGQRQENYREAESNQPEGDVESRNPVAKTDNRPAHGGRLTSKQLALIQKLTGERRVSRTELTQHCQDRYGRVPDFLTKAQASKIIDDLMAGHIHPAQTG